MAAGRYLLLTALFGYCVPSVSLLSSGRQLWQQRICPTSSLEAISRRGAGSAFVSGVVALVPNTAMAKGKMDESNNDRQKLYKGYQRLDYLLQNWEKETTVCGKNTDDNPYLTGGKCERTPIKVMDYLGYKNTEDPLFRADRTMRRLEAEVPAGRESEYLEAIEQWIEAADEGSGMAYISSWGEANPGGGKDRVQLFIERAKKNVMDAQQSLATVIDILEIKASNA